MEGGDMMLKIYSDGGQHHDGRDAADRPKTLQRWCVEAFSFSYLTLHLVPIASRVFKASFASSCVFAQEKTYFLKKNCSSAPRYITPPFSLALPNSFNPNSVGW